MSCKPGQNISRRNKDESGEMSNKAAEEKSKCAMR